MAEDVTMLAADGRRWRRARVAVWVVLVLSLATWPFSLADLGPNPERLPIWLWASLAWAWPMCVLVLVWGRVPRWARIALVCVVLPFSALMLFIAVRLGTGYRVQVLEPLAFAGRPIRLAVVVAPIGWRECQLAEVVLAGGWLLQHLDFSACSEESRGHRIDPDTFALDPGPSDGTFVLSVERTLGDSEPQRERIGVYRLGLGGQLVRMAGDDDNRR